MPEAIELPSNIRLSVATYRLRHVSNPATAQIVLEHTGEWIVFLPEPAGTNDPWGNVTSRRVATLSEAITVASEAIEDFAARSGWAA